MKTEVAGEDKDERCTIHTLTHRTCRWPLGDPKQPDFRFCGKKKKFGSPYCEQHHKGAFLKGDNREIREPA